MIKNDRQLKITKQRLNELKEGLERIGKKYSSNKKKCEFLSKGYLLHIEQLRNEITEYEKMKKSPLPKVLRAHDLDEISRQLVRLRLARGLTQAELAARIGCKQADVSRLEREDYQGYTIGQLKKIAANLDAEIEIDLIPV
jgi:predicted XRE-type DNA-binding protein